MVIGTALGWSDLATLALAVVLATAHSSPAVKAHAVVHHHHNTDEHATASMSATTPTTLIDNPPTLAATSQPQPSCRPAGPAFHDDKQISKLASMLGGMTRITVTMDDRLAAAVRATAGHNVSGWLAALVRHKLLEQAIAAEIACDQQHPDYRVWCDERLEEIEEARA